MQQVFHRNESPAAPVLGRAAFTLVELLVVVGIIAVLIGILVPVASRARESANRVKCAGNLRSVGQLLTSYAAANKGNYPRTFYDAKKIPMQFTDAVPTSAAPYQPKGATSSEPFSGTTGSVGPNNVPAALFLLIRTQGTTTSLAVDQAHLGANYEAIAPETFICPSAGDVMADPFEGGGNRGNAKRHSNFSWLPTNLSYSYANPYPDAQNRSYRLNSGEMINDFVVAADYNPGKSGSYDVTAVTEASPSAEMRKGNSANHKGTGQNVLYGDGRVSFETTPFCGKNRDNIYTVSGSTDGKVTTSTTIVGSPAWQWDSVVLPATGK
jgi:prepilin-type N-terminal cleavage/methylation domain-containing protein